MADDFLLLSFELGFDECLVANNDVLILLVDFHNLELHCLANEYVVVADGLNVNLAAGQECFDAEYVDNHTTLCAALDVTIDNLLSLQGCIDAVPRLRQTSLLVREYELTFLVLSVLYINLNNVSGFQVRIVTEFRSGDDTVALVADVNDYLFLVYADNLTVNDLMFANLVEGFVVRLVKLFFADISCQTILKLFPIEIL